MNKNTVLKLTKDDQRIVSNAGKQARIAKRRGAVDVQKFLASKRPSWLR